MIKNIILDVGKVLVAWEPEDAMKQLGFDDKTVKAVADATVNTPVWPETDRGVWSDEQILQAFYEKAPIAIVSTMRNIPQRTARLFPKYSLRNMCCCRIF